MGLSTAVGRALALAAPAHLRSNHKDKTPQPLPDVRRRTVECIRTCA